LKSGLQMRFLTRFKMDLLRKDVEAVAPLCVQEEMTTLHRLLDLTSNELMKFDVRVAPVFSR